MKLFKRFINGTTFLIATSLVLTLGNRPQSKEKNEAFQKAATSSISMYSNNKIEALSETIAIDQNASEELNDEKENTEIASTDVISSQKPIEIPTPTAVEIEETVPVITEATEPTISFEEKEERVLNYTTLSKDEMTYFANLAIEQSTMLGDIGNGFASYEDVINAFYDLSNMTTEEKINIIMEREGLSYSQVDTVLAICAAEAGYSYIDGYAVGNTLVNRVHSNTYRRYYSSNLYDQATYPSQYVVYENGSYYQHLGDTEFLTYGAALDSICSEYLIINYVGFRGYDFDGAVQLVSGGNYYCVPVSLKDRYVPPFNSITNISVTCSYREKDGNKFSNVERVMSGAAVELYNENDELVETWLSTDEVHTIYGLKPGKYYLVETNLPLGYSPANEKTIFTVENENVPLEITVKNYCFLYNGHNYAPTTYAKPKTKTLVKNS